MRCLRVKRRLIGWRWGWPRSVLVRLSLSPLEWLCSSPFAWGWATGWASP